MNDSPLIVALDVANKEEAISLVLALKDKVKIFKVGLELFLANGREIVDFINGENCEVFLDLKFFDIPNQVVGACREILKANIRMFTIHTLGGFDMMKKVVSVVDEVSAKKEIRPFVLGVTLLTSFNQSDIINLGFTRGIIEQVVHLANQAKQAGLDGVVASPNEVEEIRKNLGKDFLVVAPGVRSEWSDWGDQKRVLTPGEAIRQGASYVVVGRPIIKADNPSEAAEKILSEIRG